MSVKFYNYVELGNHMATGGGQPKTNDRNDTTLSLTE